MKQPVAFIVLGVSTFLLLSIPSYFFLAKSQHTLVQNKTEQITDQKIEIKEVSITPTSSPKLAPTTTLSPIKASSSLSPTPTVIPTSIPTPQPKKPNPPIINIGYPQEMQSITMTSVQQLCVVDIPSGGDTSSLQRKNSINDGGWSAYADIYSLCLDPKEGLNKFQLQYRNKFGDESTIYTRQFTFHRKQDITVTLSGQVYNDLNCNNVKESGETGYSETIDIMQPDGLVLATIASDSGGNYSFSKTIQEDDSITIQPSPRDYNLRYYPPTVTLNGSNKSSTIDISHCP